MFTEDEGNEEEIKAKIKKGTMCSEQIMKVLKSMVSIKIYKTGIRPTIIG